MKPPFKYVKAPIDSQDDNAYWVEFGVIYPVKFDSAYMKDSCSFYVGEQPFRNFCLVKNCAHLGGKDWIPCTKTGRLIPNIAERLRKAYENENKFKQTK